MRFVLILLLLVPSTAWAQNHFCGKSMLVASGGGIEYPFTSSGSFNTAGAKFWIDFSQDPSSSPITSNEGTYSWTVGNSPVRIYDGTHPAGIGGTEGRAWQLVSTIDGVYRADDGALDLATKSTLVVVVTQFDDASTNSTMMRKIEFGPTQGYELFRSSQEIRFRTSNAGDRPYIAIPSSTLNGGINCIVVTLDGTAGYGASTGAMYIDEIATGGTCGTGSCSTLHNVPDVTGATQVYGAGVTSLAGIHYAAYYSSTIWTEAQSRAFCRKFYGLYADNGQDYLDITSSSPAATLLSTSGGPSTLVSTSANNAIVGAHGYYAHPAIDNLVQRSSFESWPTWDETVTAGDGSAAVAQVSTATAAHGLSHISMTLTGTTSAAEVRSACVTSGISSDLYVQAMVKKGSGTTQAAIKIHEYSDASCSTSIGATDIVAATDVTTSWVEYGGQFAAASWNGSTSSWKIELHETCNGGCDSHFDAVQARSASVPTDSWCVTCDTDATCSCTASVSTIPQPFTATGGWKMTATIRSPIDGAVTSPDRFVYHVPGTAGNNNRMYTYWDNDTLTATIHNAAGAAQTATVAAAGNADTDYDIEVTRTATGVLTVCWEGSCGTPKSGATQDNISTTFHVGNNGSSGGEAWIKNLKFEDL